MSRFLKICFMIGLLFMLFFLSWSGIEKLRFKPAFNPYTEPSMEVFSYHEGNNSRNLSTKHVCAENAIIPCCCIAESNHPPSM